MFPGTRFSVFLVHALRGTLSHVPYICAASDNIVENNFEKCRCWGFFYEVKKKIYVKL